MRKKMLSLALALVLCLGLMTIPAMAAGYTEVVPCKYEEVGDFSEGLASVAIQVGTDAKGNAIVRWGFIDKTGKEVIPCQYCYTSSKEEVGPSFSEGLAAVQDENNNLGYIDKTGKVVIPFQYSMGRNFSEGLAPVYLNGKWGYIDKAGQVVIPYQYDEARSFSEGLARVRIGRAGSGEILKFGYIDKTGKEVIPFRPYNVANDFSEGFATVIDENNKWGLIDKTGKEVIPCQYAMAGDFSEGFAWVQNENYERYFIDQTGKTVISYRYKNAYSFYEGLAMVQEENFKWGFIDKTGKVVIPFQYNGAGSTLNGFFEGAAVVILAGKYGYIDKTGREVVPCQYASARRVSEGMAAVAVKGENNEARNFKWGFISFDGTQPAAPAVSTVGGFTDVKTGDYFADPVLWAVEKNITQGTGNGQFSPNVTCNQGQILTFLWRAQGEPKPSGTVSGTQYYATAAQWAKEQGLTDNFSAEADCTRAMVVTYLWKLAGSPNAGTPDFTDVSANADYAQAVAWAVEQGITSGTGNGQFSPNGICNRGQIVTFLYRAFAK